MCRPCGLVLVFRPACFGLRAVDMTAVVRPDKAGVVLLLSLSLAACALGGAGAIDNVLSYKSLVLGSLSSGQRVSGRVSRSSCHNYFMNVTDFGYNLVVDLDSRSPSSQLFLLVKASPILRHSLEDEHNYASYYQFKKQGEHHGVVVTSEHLSPGRWYIGVCNYVQEVAIFDDTRAASRHSTPFSDDAEYTVVATLNRTKEQPVRPEEGVEDVDDKSLETDRQGFVDVDIGDKGSRSSASGVGLCNVKTKESRQDGVTSSAQSPHPKGEKLPSGDRLLVDDERWSDTRPSRTRRRGQEKMLLGWSDGDDQGTLKDASSEDEEPTLVARAGNAMEKVVM